MRSLGERVYALDAENLTCFFTRPHSFVEAEALLTRVREVQAEDGRAHDPALFVTTANLAHCMHEQVRAAAVVGASVQVYLFHA